MKLHMVSKIIFHEEEIYGKKSILWKGHKNVQGMWFLPVNEWYKFGTLAPIRGFFSNIYVISFHIYIDVISNQYSKKWITNSL